MGGGRSAKLSRPRFRERPSPGGGTGAALECESVSKEEIGVPSQVGRGGAKIRPILFRFPMVVLVELIFGKKFVSEAPVSLKRKNLLNLFSTKELQPKDGPGVLTLPHKSECRKYGFTKGLRWPKKRFDFRIFAVIITSQCCSPPTLCSIRAKHRRWLFFVFIVEKITYLPLSF